MLKTQIDINKFTNQPIRHPSQKTIKKKTYGNPKKNPIELHQNHGRAPEEFRRRLLGRCQGLPACDLVLAGFSDGHFYEIFMD